MTTSANLICGVLTRRGTPCENLAQWEGDICWRHRPKVEDRPYAQPETHVVTAFKCPHCGGLTEVK